MTLQTAEAPPWQRPVRQVVKLSDGTNGNQNRTSVKASTGGTGIPTPRGSSRTSSLPGGPGQQLDASFPRAGSCPGGQGQQLEAGLMSVSAGLQLQKEREAHQQEIEFLKEQVEEQQQEIDSLKARIKEQNNEHRAKVDQIKKETDELLAKQTAFHEREALKCDAKRDAELQNLRDEHAKKLAEATSAGEKEVARLRGLANERSSVVESGLKFQLTELEDQVQKQRSELRADTDRKLAAQAQKFENVSRGLYERLYKQGGAAAAFWCEHVLHVAFVMWRGTVCVAKSKAKVGQDFAQEREDSAKLAAQHRAEVDGALQRHQEESAANAQAALQKELELMKQKTVLEQRCDAQSTCAKATFDRFVADLQKSCLAQVLRLWALTSRLARDAESNSQISLARLDQFEAQQGEHEKALKLLRDALIAGSKSRDHIIEQLELRSVEFLVVKQWQFVVVDARHEKRLQRAIEDEKERKSLDQWAELRRQVKEEKEYRKFIFVAAINEQAKRRMQAAFLVWRGEVKIWALEAWRDQVLAMEDGSEDEDSTEHHREAMWKYKCKPT